MNIRGSNIIVTGGCGFIGGILVKELVTQGADITVLDINLDPRSLFSQNKLEKVVDLQILDIRDKNKVLKIFKKRKPSYVIHLAAEPLVENSFKDPYRTFETNIMGTVNILEAIRSSKNIEGVIIASSDKAYGKSNITCKEDTPLRGDHPYDVSKSCEDLIAKTYHQTYNLPIVITRFANVYGEGDLNFGRIIPDICKAIVKKEKLLLRSNGNYVRDYIYVKDVALGYIFLLKNLNKAKGEAYNFSSEDTLSVIELVRIAEKILKAKLKIKILNNAKNEIPYQHLDDGKIRNLGWSPKYTLTNTLEKVLNWYKDLLMS